MIVQNPQTVTKTKPAPIDVDDLLCKSNNESKTTKLARTIEIVSQNLGCREITINRSAKAASNPKAAGGARELRLK